MATTTAIVTEDGLALTPEAMERFDLRLGAQVTVTIEPRSMRPLPPEAEQLIHDAMGMLRDLPGMAEELQRERREDDTRPSW